MMKKINWSRVRNLVFVVFLGFAFYEIALLQKQIIFLHQELVTTNIVIEEQYVTIDSLSGIIRRQEGINQSIMDLVGMMIMDDIFKSAPKAPAKKAPPKAKPKKKQQQKPKPRPYSPLQKDRQYTT